MRCLGANVGVCLANYDDLVVMFSCVIDKFEEVGQEIRANNDGRGGMDLQDTRKKLLRAEGNRDYGVFGECKIGDDKLCICSLS